MFKILVIIGTGSFIGGVSRYLTTRFIQDTFIASFPFGTFIVNLLGCFLVGLFYGLSERGNGMSDDWRMFLTIGFCGGFTTFSTFSYENFSMLKNGDFFQVALYAGLSVFLGLMFTYFGSVVTKIV